jgi:hypothetical protein
MKLMTKTIEKQLPKLYAQEESKEPKAYVKYFCPWNNWTWYGMEYDGKDTFFGYVKGLSNEYGYFSLAELESLKGPYGLGIERDKFFQATPVEQVKEDN